MHKMHEQHMQNTQMVCLKRGNIKFSNVMLKIQKAYTQKQISVIGYTVRGQALIRELTIACGIFT